jgi:hypothetical protein
VTDTLVGRTSLTSMPCTRILSHSEGQPASLQQSTTFSAVAPHSPHLRPARDRHVGRQVQLDVDVVHGHRLPVRKRTREEAARLDVREVGRQRVQVEEVVEGNGRVLLVLPVHHGQNEGPPQQLQQE